MKNEASDLKPASPKPWYDPRVRSVFFQIIAIALVFWGGWSLVDNTLSNMESRGISTGFGFLNETAGFGIIMSMVPYDATMTYGRTFLVGLANTLLVSAMGIVTATILGFIIGVARLSSNWLVAKLALTYVEIIRNIPLLLQIFFWYFAVLASLPSPRQSVDLGGTVFLNNRGLYLPEPLTQDGFWSGLGGCVCGDCPGHRAAGMGQKTSACHRTVVPNVQGRSCDTADSSSAGLRVRRRTAGMGTSFAAGLQFWGRHIDHPGTGGSVDCVISVHGQFHCRDCAFRYCLGQQRPDRSC